MADTPPIMPPGAVAQPHRGTTILVLGILSLVINACGLGWILGLIAWIMGAGDLKKMQSGMIDREGEGMTRAGMICGIVSVALAAIAIVIYLVMAVVFGIAIIGGAAAGGAAPAP